MMRERDLQLAVIEMAHVYGWLVAHFRTAQTRRGAWVTPVGADGKGFPDLCLVRERVVFLELKVRYRGLTDEQKLWRDRIVAAGGEWHLVTDRSWHKGYLDEVLIGFVHPSRHN
jgi:hypothetical protein